MEFRWKSKKSPGTLTQKALEKVKKSPGNSYVGCDSVEHWKTDTPRPLLYKNQIFPYSPLNILSGSNRVGDWIIW